MNPTTPPVKSYELILGKGLKVITDRKSKTRVINLPFDFPDGSKGIVIICKVKDEDWDAHKEISKISLNFT